LVKFLFMGSETGESWLIVLKDFYLVLDVCFVVSEVDLRFLLEYGPDSVEVVAGCGRLVLGF